MAYEYLTQYDAKCYTAGRPNGIDSITIHWWDDPANNPSFDGVVNMFVNGTRQTSAHYVVEANKVACLVNCGDRAWACGDGIGCNSGGNDRSISLECNPRQSDEDYNTIAELIANIRKVYGDLPLKRHSDWSATRCPGTYDLDRLDRLARGVDTAKTEVKVTVETQQAPTVDLEAIATDIIRGVYGNGVEHRRSQIDGKFGAGVYDKAQAIVNQRLL